MGISGILVFMESPFSRASATPSEAQNCLVHNSSRHRAIYGAKPPCKPLSTGTAFHAISPTLKMSLDFVLHNIS
jgi:hypothetical protein